MITKNALIGRHGAIALLGLSTLGNGAFGDSVCVDNTGTGPDICVEWVESPDPVEGQDFEVDFDCTGCEAAPDLRLRTGSLTWGVWSKDGANPGDFGAITATDPEDFIIRVWNFDSDSPGAHNVGSIELEPTGDHSSSIAQVTGDTLSEITGEFTGPLTLQQTFNNTGFCLLKVGGDVKGTWTVPGDVVLDIGGSVTSTANLTLGAIDRFTVSIGVDVDGPIEVTQGIHGVSEQIGRFIVGGDLNANLTLRDVEDYAEIRIDGDCTATINFHPTGDPFTSTLEIGKQLTATGLINMNGSKVHGTIRIKDAGAGDVMGIRELGNSLTTATIVLGDAVGDSFTGSFTSGSLFGSTFVDLNIGTLGSGGDVTIRGLGSTGTVDVLGDVAGTLTVSGLDMDGAISVAGDVSGDVVVNEDSVDGTISVTGEVTGDVHVKGDAGGINVDGGLVSVGRILVDGEAKDGITLGMSICPSALIRVVGGLASTGFIDMDPDTTNCSALGDGGDIQIGNGGDVIFHPSAYVLISDGAGGGDWDGDIIVNGCFTADPGANVEICVCGTMTGVAFVTQPCIPTYDTPTPACNSHCP